VITATVKQGRKYGYCFQKLPSKRPGKCMLGFVRPPPISALKIVRQLDDSKKDRCEVSHPTLPPTDPETKQNVKPLARLVESVTSPAKLAITAVGPMKMKDIQTN
jgi:hypothetical protein